MQFIFFVPPNEELEGTLHPQKFGCTPKNEGKRVHVPPDEKTCGHTGQKLKFCQWNRNLYLSEFLVEKTDIRQKSQFNLTLSCTFYMEINIL
jgi:hypothetical protein